MGRRILVPVDGSDESKAALEYALEEYPGESIHVVHALNPLEEVYISEPGTWDETLIERQRDRARALLDETEGLATDRDASITTTLVTGSPAREILEYAEGNDVDHLVIGSRGRSGVSRVLLGSVAETVVRRASVPVTVVR